MTKIHDAKIIELTHKVEVDEKIADIIIELNNAGFTTTYSCQGDAMKSGYISFLFLLSNEEKETVLKICRKHLMNETCIFDKEPVDVDHSRMTICNTEEQRLKHEKKNELSTRKNRKKEYTIVHTYSNGFYERTTSTFHSLNRRYRAIIMYSFGKEMKNIRQLVCYLNKFDALEKNLVKSNAYSYFKNE